MARYLLASGVDQFFGSHGGATFQRSGKVFSIRKRAVPIQKRTARQSVVKNAFNTMQKRWKNISGANQATWSTFQADYPRTDSLGNTYLLAPHILCTSSNILRISIGRGTLSTLTAAIAGVPIVDDTFSCRPSVSAFDIVLLPVNVQTNCRVIFYCGAPTLTPVIGSRANTFLIGHRNSGQSTFTPNWYPQYSALFPNVVNQVGMFIPVFVSVVMDTNAQEIASFGGFSDIIP
jgi:hypothetical protein